MRLDHYSPPKLKKEIQNIVGKHLDINEYKLFFFGSRVLGKGDDRSDIDIGIEGESPIPFSVLSTIREELENLPTLYTFDIVDFNGVSDSFKKIAKKRVEYIN